MRFNERHGGRRAGAGRRYLIPGERTVKLEVRLPESVKAAAKARAHSLGMTEAEWARRLIVNALLRVPS